MGSCNFFALLYQMLKVKRIAGASKFSVRCTVFRLRVDIRLHADAAEVYIGDDDGVACAVKLAGDAVRKALPGLERPTTTAAAQVVLRRFALESFGDVEVSAPWMAWPGP